MGKRLLYKHEERPEFGSPVPMLKTRVPHIVPCNPSPEEAETGRGCLASEPSQIRELLVL